MELLLASENIVFSAALLLMLLIAILQALGLGDFAPDLDADLDVDLDLDTDIDAVGDGLLGFLGIGKLPLLMLLVVFLSVFGLVGLSGQQLMQNLIGHYLDPWLAVPAVFIASWPLTGLLARSLAKIIPKDESSAVNVDSLVGRSGKIQIGKAIQGSPARAEVKDVHGQNHYVMVEPDNPDQIFNEGEEILLVRRNGELFRAISRGAHYLPKL